MSARRSRTLADPSARANARDATAEVAPDPGILVDLATMRMPFGRYRGRLLVDLPEPYVVWFRKQGFPPGRLGVLLATLYEVKANGLERLVREVGRRARA